MYNSFTLPIHHKFHCISIERHVGKTSQISKTLGQVILKVNTKKNMPAHIIQLVKTNFDMHDVLPCNAAWD
jgi:hypothetical protein